jgi:hypothetical protein
MAVNHWFRHEYKPIAVNNRFEPWRDALTGIIHKDCGAFRTDILLRCICGKLQTKTLKGQWSLKQVTTESLDQMAVEN